MTKWQDGKYISTTSNLTDGSANAAFFFSFLFFFLQIADTYTQHTDLTFRLMESFDGGVVNPKTKKKKKKERTKKKGSSGPC